MLTPSKNTAKPYLSFADGKSSKAQQNSCPWAVQQNTAKTQGREPSTPTGSKTPAKLECDGTAKPSKTPAGTPQQNPSQTAETLDSIAWQRLSKTQQNWRQSSAKPAAKTGSDRSHFSTNLVKNSGLKSAEKGEEECQKGVCA